MKKRNIFIIISILCLVIIDQLSKLIVTNKIVDDDIIIIKGFLSLSKIKNYGAAFGILEGRIIFFIIITIVVLFYLIYELLKNNERNKLYIVSLILIIGGIIGNFIDRLALGYVRDFISLSIFNPIFNLADSFIVIGVVLFVISDIVGGYYGSKRRVDR